MPMNDETLFISFVYSKINVSVQPYLIFYPISLPFFFLQRTKGKFLTINNSDESQRLLQDVTTTTTTTTNSASYQAMNGQVTT